MFLDYELVISCAFAALVILRIVHLRRERRRLRDRLSPIALTTHDPRDTKMTKRAIEGDSDPKSAGVQNHFVDRLIIFFLVVALLWFGARIWMQYGAPA